MDVRNGEHPKCQSWEFTEDHIQLQVEKMNIGRCKKFLSSPRHMRCGLDTTGYNHAAGRWLALCSTNVEVGRRCDLCVAISRWKHGTEQTRRHQKTRIL